jgi:predicted small lipoprotein YifL
MIFEPKIPALAQWGRARFVGRCAHAVIPALVLVLLAVALAGCGKKGMPQSPPDEPNTYPRTYPSV